MKRIFSIFFLSVIVVTTTGAGYVGTLPDVEAEFLHKEKAVSPYSVEELDKQNEERLKPIPRNDDTYIDIIIKQDKTSQYENDINAVILILEKLRRCLNTNQNIQHFNAIVSNFIDNVDYIYNEYKNKPESNYMSYNKLLLLSQEARDTASYRTKGLAIMQYQPYTASDNIYTKENLEEKLETLLNDVTETIFILKNLE